MKKVPAKHTDIETNPALPYPNTLTNKNEIIRKLENAFVTKSTTKIKPNGK